MPTLANVERFELDEIGKCYFAALIYGLSIIAEKEENMGMPFGTAETNADALIHFVRRKGDMLVHHFMNEEDRQKPYHVRWTREEMQQVATEARRRFPDEEELTIPHFIDSQIVLPEDRRKPNLNYSTKLLLRSLADQKPPRKYKKRTVNWNGVVEPKDSGHANGTVVNSGGKTFDEIVVELRRLLRDRREIQSNPAANRSNQLKFEQATNGHNADVPLSGATTAAEQEREAAK